MTPRSNLAEHVRWHLQRIEQCGDDAVAGLLDLTAHRLVRLATTITRNQHDGEDAVQTAYVRVAAAPAKLLAAHDAWAYLLQMVRNESLVIMRRRRPVAMPETVAAGLTDVRVSPNVDVLEKHETHRAVWLAMRQLPATQSEVIVLKIWEQMSLAQIAALLEIPPPTVASRYRYGMQKLEGLLRGQITDVTAEVPR